MTTILKEMRIVQVCSKSERTLETNTNSIYWYFSTFKVLTVPSLYVAELFLTIKSISKYDQHIG